MQSSFKKIQARLGYVFQDQSLLETALRHRSLGSNHNERLEFLGDAALGVAIGHELYQRYPNATEGELSRMRSSLVNSVVLAEVAQALGLQRAVQLGQSESKSGGRKRASIAADAVEAVLGAIFLDGGYAACAETVRCWFEVRLAALAGAVLEKDAKTRLQEWLHARKLPLPVYTVVSHGQAHVLTLEATCQVSGLPLVTEGKGPNRRLAETAAAAAWLSSCDILQTKQEVDPK